ncbi:carboxymuconolactone decarboxylase family protein [Afipia sp. DC4300-2b1]|uniref:carboxymuconolactone decarboxylase family protein n=1 Tax=Afipia sp. DC4300-2b1 TaxID=2804672 RepID=UPI003CEFF138
MKQFVAAVLSLALATPIFAQGGITMSDPLKTASSLTVSDIQSISPALGRYAREDIVDGLWKRPQLSARDRSIVALSILIARNQSIDMAHYMNVAMDSGVTPREVSEIITHLAFYSGWSNAMSAVVVAKGIFAQRKIGTDQLPEASSKLLPLDAASEANRAASVDKTVGPVSPGLVQYTTDPLFKDLWLRPDLKPRDRSLVTISSLIANGQMAQLTPHLNKAMDNGLTKDEAGEVIAQATEHNPSSSEKRIEYFV